MFFGDQIGKRKHLKKKYILLTLLCVKAWLSTFDSTFDYFARVLFLGSAVKRELRWVIPRKAAVQVKAYPACGIPN